MTVASQAPLSMGFSRQEYWIGLPSLLQGHLPDPGIEAVSPALAGGFFTAKQHASKVMLKILQARLHQYVNRELLDVQAGFRKGRGTRDQIANICWIMEKAREFQKNIFFCFIDYAKTFDCVDHNKLWKF